MSSKREKSREIGQLMRDRPMSPSEEVVWWAGYIIRTGGAKHLQSSGRYLYW